MSESIAENNPKGKESRKAGDLLAGRYKLVSELGRGSMGVVYKAVQEPMGRPVAIKTLLPHAVEHPRLIGRFKREVQVISKLRHPNTVTIFDYGDLEDGALFFAMELLEGISLGSVIRRYGPLAPERVRHICIQILRSLGEAHEKGIIHRDLKPDNISLEEIGGEKDYVKVLDFGIAKALRPEPDTQDLTGAGVTVGTPVYMAPEQFNHEEVNAATDLYALGHMMYEMLGGRPIFQGSSWIEIAMHKMDNRPIKLRDDIICSELGGVIVKAIKKKPGERYQSAAEMLEDLRSVGDLAGKATLKHARDVSSMKADTHQLVVQTPFGPRAVTNATQRVPDLAKGSGAAADKLGAAASAPAPQEAAAGGGEQQRSAAGSQDSIEDVAKRALAISDAAMVAISVPPLSPGAESAPTNRPTANPEGSGGASASLDERGAPHGGVQVDASPYLEETSLDDLLDEPMGEEVTKIEPSLSQQPLEELPPEPFGDESTVISQVPEFELPPPDPMAAEATSVVPDRAMLTPHPVHQTRAGADPVMPEVMAPESRNLLVVSMIGAGLILLFTAIVLISALVYFNLS